MATYEMSDVDVAEVRGLIAGSRLQSVDFYEVSARRHDAEVTEDEGAQGSFNIETQYRLDEEGFGVRLRARLVFPHGEAIASVAGEYEFLDDLQPRERAVQLFINEVAVMTVYPYLREAVASVTTKVFGAPIHMPLIERGQIGLDIDGEQIDEVL